jgi:hypothetical protein
MMSPPELQRCSSRSLSSLRMMIDDNIREYVYTVRHNMVSSLVREKLIFAMVIKG